MRCRESQSHIAVDFRSGELPAGIPKDVALSLFRITQEALRNAARHSQTERIDLVLNADAECIRLKVQDYGCGFDVARTRGQPGLGLASMQERARFVGGDIQIESVPGQGTSIVVSLPLPEEAWDGLPIHTTNNTTLRGIDEPRQNCDGG